MCATVQHVTPGHRIIPAMHREQDGHYYCTDAIDCLARRRELISRMESALDRAWGVLAARLGWPRPETWGWQ